MARERPQGEPRGPGSTSDGADAARDMTVIAAHVNPDFDAYGSMVAATRLYPGSVALWSGAQNANVREFHSLHGEFLEFIDLKSLDASRVARLVLVDTRDPGRLGEVAAIAADPLVALTVYDHHPRATGDVARGEDRGRDVGATTSILAHELRSGDVELSALEASAMLLGIHEDTGSLTYPGSTSYDADAVAFLMAQGADLQVVEQFLDRPLDADQRELLDTLERTLTTWRVRGHDIAVATAESPRYVDSSGLVTHYLLGDLGLRVAIAVIATPERVQIVGRSRTRDVDIAAVLAHLGGGGHPQAASAAVRGSAIAPVLERLRTALDIEVAEPIAVAAVASAPVRSVSPAETMEGAGRSMARWGGSVLPVVEGGQVRGLIGRRDVDKAIRHGLGHAPVTGFMNRRVVTAEPAASLDAVERLMVSSGVPAVLIVADGRLSGIVTHGDLLRAEHGASYLRRRTTPANLEASDRFRASFAQFVPAEVRETVQRIGRLAQVHGVRAYVVGGFVRDMLRCRRNLDIDIVVEGDGIAFARRLAEDVGAHIRTHLRFGTAVIVMPDGLHVDVTSARSEYYARPGALPAVEQASMRHDLLRRDFSINAMAAAIDPSEFGVISDPYGGLADLEAGAVRVLHPLSFVEDPTRVLRAARFEARLGFAMEAHTEDLARHAVELGLLGEVSGARIREELLAILEEENPIVPLRRLLELGALPELLPAGVDVARVLEELSVSIRSIETMPKPKGRGPRRTSVAVVAVVARAGTTSAERWIERLRIGRETAAVARRASADAARLLTTLERGGPMKDSRVFSLLDGLPVELLAYLRAVGGPLVMERVDRYATTLSRMELSVSGDDLIAAGATPSAAFSDILARVRSRLLDGAVAGRDQELSELLRIASRAGVIPHP